MKTRRDNKTQRDPLLPPPELLARYDDIEKGMSKKLVEIIKKEQEHRQSLQKKYLFHYRLGQLFGFGYGIFIMCKIFELAKMGKENVAYTLTVIFGVLTLVILSQYKKDRRSASIRSQKRQNNSGQNRTPNRQRRDGQRQSRPRNRNYNRKK